MVKKQNKPVERLHVWFVMILKLNTLFIMLSKTRDQFSRILQESTISGKCKWSKSYFKQS